MSRPDRSTTTPSRLVFLFAVLAAVACIVAGLMVGGTAMWLLFGLGVLPLLFVLVTRSVSR